MLFGVCVDSQDQRPMVSIKWPETDEVPSPPLNDKGRPRWPHAHQAKVTFLDTEFLGWEKNANLFTEIAIWHLESLLPQVWKIRPAPLDLARAMDTPYAEANIRKAMELNGYNEKEWADAPLWVDVRMDIAREIFGRILCGNNVWDADILRLKNGLYPRDTQWIRPTHLELQDMAKIAGHKKTSLDALCKAYGIEEETVHRAEGGVRRVREVARRMLGVGSD